MDNPKDAQEDAARLVRAFYAAQEQNRDLLPYIGPEDTLNRFLAGDVVTKGDLLTDQSLWTVQAMLPQQMRRLGWMLDNIASAAAGVVQEGK